MDINLLTQPPPTEPKPKHKWVILGILASLLLGIVIYHLKISLPEPKKTIPVMATLPIKPIANPAPPIQWINDHEISVDFDNIPIAEALRQIAKFTHRNIVVSPSVRGQISLHWPHIEPKMAIFSLIQAQHLSQWQSDDIRYVATQAEFMQYKQEEIKLNKILTENEPLVLRVFQIHYAKAEDIAAILQDNHHSLLSKRGQIRVDARTNILCIQDVGSHFQELTRLIQRLDVPVRQVLIEAQLATVDSDYERELGIQFKVGSHENLSAGWQTGPYSLAVATLADGSLLNMQLAALENTGHAEVISSPSLFTANQQTASIESGEEIPYQETNASGATSVAFKKAVLSLKVTPQIMPGNQILLQLQVNQDKPSSRIVLGVPAINTRQINTRILVKTGKTIVLGGIYETNNELAEKRIPFLSKIPLVGWLLSQQNVIDRKRELLIFVTPKIIQ